MRKIKTKTVGVTLIELLITLAVLCILSAFALPYLQKRLAAMEAFKVESNLRLMLSQAKQQAYLERQRLAICATHDGQTCDSQAWSKQMIVFRDHANANRIREPQEVIKTYVVIDAKYGHLAWQGSGGNNPVFHADSGLPRGGNGTFKYCSNYPEYHFHLLMSDMGNVRIVKPLSC